MAEGNGTPGIGEVNRAVIKLEGRFDTLDSKVDAQAISQAQQSVEIKGIFGQVKEIRGILQANQDRRSGFSWQVAAMVVGAIAIAAILALIASSGRTG